LNSICDKEKIKQSDATHTNARDLSLVRTHQQSMFLYSLPQKYLAGHAEFYVHVSLL